MRDRHIEAGDGGLVSEVVERCIRRELFNAGLFEKYGVLTNSDIQETYLKTNARKQEISFIKEYALPVVYRFIENASKNKQNVNILFKNVSNSSATILDDIKLDDIIVDEGIGTYGLHDNVKMHSEVFDKLGVLLTGKIRDDYINRLSGWIKTKAPNFSGDPAATIQKWVNKDLADGKLTVPNSKGKSYTSEQLNILFNKLSYEDL
jgi:hypothetical protein